MINNLYDVTMVPPISNSMLMRLNSEALVRNNPDACFTTASAQLLQNRGQECIRNLCGCINGIESDFGCPDCPQWNKIQDYCGSPQTSGFYNHGSWWQRYPAPNLPQGARPVIGPQHINPHVYSLGQY